MNDAFWDWPREHNQRVRYLCWRACGLDRWDSLWYSLNGYMPANWAITRRQEEDDWV